MSNRTRHDVDVAVIGGGLAGVAAAIAAARNGATVALVQDRPVLGGNSSSEVRVWVCGATATGHHRFARETGIIGELYVENEYRNPLGNPYYWDLVVLDAVKAEPRITLLLNTHITEVQMHGDRISSVGGIVLGSEGEVTVAAHTFVDATGDGSVAARAGARTRLGREASAAFGEDLAPEEEDELTLGSTLLFYTRKESEPVPFVPPAFAIDLAATTIPESRVLRTGDNGADYWWIEWGGELDIVADNERIRDELWAVIYGIWDHIKNSGRFPDAENLTLEWVGSVPGKREYRRIIGAHTMTQEDVVSATRKADAIGFGGWSIDLHPSKGVYEPRSAAQQIYPRGTYDIPFGILRSIDVGNLLMAGRNVSATHVAFGSLRVMATCAVMGEAAGTAAALCAASDWTPAELHAAHIRTLQRRLTRQDAALIGVQDDDPANLALQARATATSELRWDELEEPDSSLLLADDTAFLLPRGQSGPVRVHLSSDEDASVSWTVHETLDGRTYFPAVRLDSGSIELPAGHVGWVSLLDELPAGGSPDTSTVVVLEATPGVRWGTSGQYLFGTVSMTRPVSAHVEEIDAHLLADRPDDVVRWGIKKLARVRLATRCEGAVAGLEAANVVGGYGRPYGGPRMWSSRPRRDLVAGDPEILTLEWEREVQASEVRVVFNDDVNAYVNNLHYVRSEHRIPPEIVADFDLEAFVDGHWRTLGTVRDNRRRHRTVAFEPVATARIRLVCHRTNGSDLVQVGQVRVY
ncbi:FAD-dependent oxidoreductase [Microbacterium sp. AGC62]